MRRPCNLETRPQVSSPPNLGTSGENILIGVLVSCSGMLFTLNSVVAAVSHGNRADTPTFWAVTGARCMQVALVTAVWVGSIA